jgi:hypothetical protein
VVVEAEITQLALLVLAVVVQVDIEVEILRFQE